MNSLYSQIRKLDFFGKPYIFEEKNHNKYTTFGGLCFSCFIIVTCVVIGFLFGQEIYLRENPTVISSDAKTDISRININEWPIFFGFINSSGINLPIAKKHIKMEISFMTISSEIKPTIFFYPGLKRCTVEEFSEFYQPYVKRILAIDIELYCINQNDMYIQNEYLSANSAFINVRFLKCNPQNYDDCSDDENEYKTLMKNFSILTILADSFADPNSYSAPLNFFVKNTSLKMSEGLLQRNYISIERRKLVTNKGWLLENKIEEEYFAVKSIDNEVSYSDNGNLFQVTLSSPNIRNKIIRSYMKIQDMLAKIGGFFNALFIFSLLATKDYVDFSFYNYIYNHFIAAHKGSSSLVTHPSNTLRHKTTIDKVVEKLAISNYSKISLNNHNNSVMFNNVKNDNNENKIADNEQYKSYTNDNKNDENNNNTIKPIAIEIINVNNNNNNDSNLQNDISNFSKVGLVNNYVNHNKNNNLNLINNKNIDEAKTRKIDNNNSRNNISIPSKILNNYTENLNRFTIENINSFTKMKLKLPENLKEMSYFSHIWNDVLCCRDKFFFQ